MLRLGEHIRLTGPELQRLERITGHKPAYIRSIADLDDYFRACLAAYAESNPWHALKRAVIESEQLRCLRALHASGVRRRLASDP